MEGTNCSITYVVETQPVIWCCGHGTDRKKGGPKMKVSITMLLKTNVEKMSVLRFATILMKTNKL
jgi:hypothetical protein